MSEQQEKYEMIALPKITQKEIDDFLFASGTKLTEQQKAMFFQMAHINGLNPFKKEIYAIPFGDKFNIITGYEVYLKRAERSGKLDGWEADYKSDSNGDYAYCTVYRKDWSKPITQKVWLSEFKQNNKMWNEKGKTMLIKVAIATTFRRAFPEEIGGLPYTSDEMPTEAEIVKPKPEPPTKPDPSKYFEEQLSLAQNKTKAKAMWKEYVMKFNIDIPMIENPEKVMNAFITWAKAEAKAAKTKAESLDNRPDDTRVDCSISALDGKADLGYCRKECPEKESCQSWRT